MSYTRRQDVLTARRVDVAVVFQRMLGTADAARYLAANSVPQEVAVRVLTGGPTRILKLNEEGEALLERMRLEAGTDRSSGG